ncbi:NAD(+) salvage pathway protein [Teratosphaeriaceae sp. CCFEE 6253]|nr:NAD(+) salvage pathway protein [Teratosphaeriaceae sp. CCFEE 6253]
MPKHIEAPHAGMEVVAVGGVRSPVWRKPSESVVCGVSGRLRASQTRAQVPREVHDVPMRVRTPQRLCNVLRRQSKCGQIRVGQAAGSSAVKALGRIQTHHRAGSDDVVRKSLPCHRRPLPYIDTPSARCPWGPRKVKYAVAEPSSKVAPAAEALPFTHQHHHQTLVLSSNLPTPLRRQRRAFTGPLMLLRAACEASSSFTTHSSPAPPPTSPATRRRQRHSSDDRPAQGRAGDRGPLRALRSPPRTRRSQNDFCPPHGALAVQGGRDLAPVIDALLNLPFALKIATRDFHPRNHISFASQHVGKEASTSSHTIANPENEEETQITYTKQRVEESARAVADANHCVQGTPGCELIPELDASKLDLVVDKGMDSRVESYSAFGPPFRNPRVAMSGLGDKLLDAGVTHVFVCGLAWDFCVKATAADAAEEGFKTFALEDACRGIDGSEEGLAAARKELESHGVRVIGVGSTDLDIVRGLKKA